MSSHLGIEMLETGTNFMIARMPVDHRTIQRIGILNGGASLALAETVGSIAASYCVDRELFLHCGSRDQRQPHPPRPFRICLCYRNTDPPRKNLSGMGHQNPQ